MAISHIGSNHATSGSGTSVAVTKPASTTQGDLLLGFFTSNNQNCTPPAGWTEIADETIEVFRAQVFYKVAGSSEPSSYTFSVGSNAPLIGTVTTLRGIDDASPIDITGVAETDLTHSEPYTTPSITGGSAGRLLYFRSVRISGSTPATFTASGATELKDVGVFSGGTVCYSQGVYLANSDYSGSGSKSGLAVTCNSSETHNFVFTVGIKSEAGVTATMGATIPSIPTVSMTGSWAYAATLGATMPMPSMTSEAFSGNFEGPLDVTVTPTVSMDGNTPVRGTLDAVVTPTVGVDGETRFFGDNSVTPEREERWFIMTQDGYYVGVRAVVDIPMRVTMPLPVVNIAATTAARAGQVSDVPAVAYEPTEIIVTYSSGTGAVTATVDNPTVLTGRNAAVDEAVSAATTAESPSIDITFGAETVIVTREAFDIIGASVLVDSNTAAVTAYNATAGNAKNVNAELVSVTAVANSASVNGSISAPAGAVTATVTTNEPTEQVNAASTGHASVNCHN